MIHYICTVFLRTTKLQLNLISHWSCFKAQTEIVHIGFIDRPRSKVQAWWFWCLIQGSMIDWYIQRHAEAEQGLSFFRSIRMGIWNVNIYTHVSHGVIHWWTTRSTKLYIIHIQSKLAGSGRKIKSQTVSCISLMMWHISWTKFPKTRSI